MATSRTALQLWCPCSARVIWNLKTVFPNNRLEMKGLVWGFFKFFRLKKKGQFYWYKAAICNLYKGSGLNEATSLDNSGN